jgi:hypothetical protein
VVHKQASIRRRSRSQWKRTVFNAPRMCCPIYQVVLMSFASHPIKSFVCNVDCNDKSTGLSFSPDDMVLYVAFQGNGTLYAIQRSPVQAKSLNLKFHVKRAN